MADKLFIRLKNISVQFYYLAQLTDTLRPDIKSCLLFYFTDQRLLIILTRLLPASGDLIFSLLAALHGKPAVTHNDRPYRILFIDTRRALIITGIKCRKDLHTHFLRAASLFLNYIPFLQLSQYFSNIFILNIFCNKNTVF